MFEAFVSIFVLSICYLKFFHNEYAECEAERQALIVSIEKLRKISQRRKPRKTKKRRLKSIN